MRKKTTPRARKKNTASSCEKTGLIAKDSNRTQSAGTKSVLDNRSHRTQSAGTKSVLDNRSHRTPRISAARPSNRKCDIPSPHLNWRGTITSKLRVSSKSTLGGQLVTAPFSHAKREPSTYPL
jgi:hypothetical protein